MSRAPTHRELEVLRYLAVGMRIGAKPFGAHTHPVTVKGVAVILIQTRTVNALLQEGWIASALDGFSLTPAGRAVVDCKTFVKAFITDAC